MLQVLLHTLIDMARIEAEYGGRKINHHGQSITVGGKDGNTNLPVNRVS